MATTRAERPVLTTVADVAEALREATEAAKKHRARPLPLDLQALGTILSVDEISGIAHVEVGVTIGQLEHALARAGLVLRHEPPLDDNETVGQCLAELSDSICGLETLLPDGRVVRLRPGPRRAVGPDLVALATLDAPRLLVTVAVYLRASRRGDEPWVGWFAAEAAVPALAGVRAFLRRGVRPIATELRVAPGGATVTRVEVNLPPPVRTASAAIIEEEMTRAGAVAAEAASWEPFVDLESRWLPFADLARAVRRPPVRVVRCEPWGAVVQFAKNPPATPRVRGPSATFEALLDRLKAELDPKGVLP